MKPSLQDFFMRIDKSIESNELSADKMHVQINIGL